MPTESQMAETLQDFIKKWGAPDTLMSDNAKAQTSKVVKQILRDYGIKVNSTEPHHPNQNPAECRIQDIKSASNIMMDRTNTPTELWYLSLQYVAYLFNRLANSTGIRKFYTMIQPGPTQKPKRKQGDSWE